MRNFLMILLIGVLANGFAAAQGKQSGSCDRACLEDTVNQYLAAMVAHNPAKAPFAKSYKLTENIAKLPPTEGLWLNASGLSDYKIYIADPKEGQIAFIGVVKELDKPRLLALRLKVVKRQIVEAEALVVRNLNEKNLVNVQTVPPAFLEALAPSERVSREQMIKISNLYFDGIEQSNGSIVPWDSECYRIENAMKTAVPRPANEKLPAFPASGPPPLMSCGDGLNTGGLSYIGGILPRRVPVVDEERGITFGVYTFNHPGFETITLKDGTTRPGPLAGNPNSMPIAEVFKIKNGKIRDILAIMTSTPYGLGDGWAPLPESFRVQK